MVKSEEEIQWFKKAAEATNRAGVVGFNTAQEGLLELDMERIFRTSLAEQGVYQAWNHIVVGEVSMSIESGVRAHDLTVDSKNRTVYMEPTNRILERGDWI